VNLANEENECALASIEIFKKSDTFYTTFPGKEKSRITFKQKYG
jgi:hypothetical protein